jgi:hypothetical protein
MLLEHRALDNSERRILESEINCGISVAEGRSRPSFKRKRTENAHFAILQLAWGLPTAGENKNTYPTQNPFRIETWQGTTQDS